MRSVGKAGSFNLLSSKDKQKQRFIYLTPSQHQSYRQMDGLNGGDDRRVEKENKQKSKLEQKKQKTRRGDEEAI